MRYGPAAAFAQIFATVTSPAMAPRFAHSASQRDKPTLGSPTWLIAMKVS
jgi:hypothetical protein